jgi:hypothetical protein
MTSLFAGYRRLDGAEAASPAPIVPSALPARSLASIAPLPPVVLPAAVLESPDELLHMLDECGREVQEARLKAGQVLEVLVDLAGALCKAEFDARLKEHGNLLAWAPADIKEFILLQVERRLNISRLADKVNLAEQYHRLEEKYGALKSENSRLKVMFQQAELELAALREPLAQDETSDAQPAEAATENMSSADTEAVDEAAAEPVTDLGRTDDLVRLVAATGLARLSRIREKLALAWQVVPKSASVRIALNAAHEAGFIKLFETRTDWRGAAQSVFVELTPAGHARARELQVEPAESEIAEGVRRGLDLGRLNLILKAADILKDEGYQSVRMFPNKVMLPENLEHAPVLSVVDTEGVRHYVECERERVNGDRVHHWQLAAMANGGAVWLITTTPALQGQLVDDLHAARKNKPFGILACNVSSYLQKERGRDQSMWLHQS